jgi:hypothetical protein
MKPATCHPERPHKARGLCSSCHQKFRRKGLAGPGPTQCVICTRIYMAKRPSRSLVCSGVCGRFRRGLERSKATGLRRVRCWTGCDEAEFMAEIRKQVIAERWVSFSPGWRPLPGAARRPDAARPDVAGGMEVRGPCDRRGPAGRKARAGENAPSSAEG